MNSLREEIGQQRPFQSLEQEAHLNLMRTASVLNDELELLIKPSGITLVQYNVLRILRGSEPEGLCRNELRDRMINRMPDVTRLLDRMEDAGLVTRSRETKDRRQVRTRLTPRALGILSVVDDIILEAHQRHLGHLSEDQLSELIDLLTLCRKGADQEKQEQ